MNHPRFNSKEFFANNVVIPKKDFIQEHTKLLKVLDKRVPTQLNAQMKEQGAELQDKLKQWKKLG